MMVNAVYTSIAPKNGQSLMKKYLGENLSILGLKEKFLNTYNFKIELVSSMVHL